YGKDNRELDPIVIETKDTTLKLANFDVSTNYYFEVIALNELYSSVPSNRIVVTTELPQAISGGEVLLTSNDAPPSSINLNEIELLDWVHLGGSTTNPN